MKNVFQDLEHVEEKAKREHVDEQYVNSVELVRFALSRLLIYCIGYRVETVLFHADALKWSLLSAVVGCIFLNLSENYS